MRIPANEKHDGIVLAWSQGHMRIALEDCADVVELREKNGRWTLDDGTLVELDGVFTDGITDTKLFGELYPRASAAGYLGASAGTWSRYQPLAAASVH